MVVGGGLGLAAREKNSPAHWRDRRWITPNQPVVGVSFWEAEACCAWSGGRLPSEQEWEASARGPNPWGNDWQDGICNTIELGLGVTSPVGLFPRSRQADLGIEDLAGNVWEWCASLYGSVRQCIPCAARRVVAPHPGQGALSSPQQEQPEQPGQRHGSVWCVRPQSGHR